ncbi:MAG: cation:proton antiporter [Actinobacteria bacterium]|nr:cation:proton antiporter [Actinomycetota bacterium]
MSEHELLVFWVDFVVLVIAARSLGALLRRFGQPAVVGELAAGVLVGPSVLGKVAPSTWDWMFPASATQSAMIVAVGWVGIVMLLAVTGFETDLGLVRQLGSALGYVAVCSIVVPLAAGVGIGFALPAAFASGVSRPVFVGFVATALSISALPVIAKVLNDLGLTRRNFGQITLAAGMVNDVVGWLLLGVLASAARSGSVKLGRLALTVFAVGVFLAAAFTVGQRLIDLLLRQVRQRRGDPSGALSVTLLVVFTVGAITQALGVEAVLGAFIAGVVIARSRYQDTRVMERIETATNAVFAPLFFATAGLRVDVGLLGRADVLLWGGIVIVVASVTKLAGGYLGARLAHLPREEGIALGVGLNSRGALEIVVATVALSLGVFNPRMYSIVVLMALVTSMLAPPFLRAIASGWEGSREEQERLERERMYAENLLVRPGRVLVPVQLGDGSLLAAKLAHLAWPQDSPATVMALDEAGSAVLGRARDVFAQRPVEEELLRPSDPAHALAEHMALGYEAVAIAAHSTSTDTDALLSPLTELVLENATLPIIVVWEGPRSRVQAMEGFRRVLVPVVGTLPNRAAQEIAFSVAATSRSDLLLAHVAPKASQPVGGPSGAQAPYDRARPARALLADATRRARQYGLRPTPVTRAGSRAREIPAIATDLDADLVVLSAELRSGEGFALLGDLIEQVVQNLDATIAVVVTPPAWLLSHG